MCIVMLGGEDTSVVCNESRKPHTSHYPSRPVAKEITNILLTSHYPSRPVETSFLKSCNDMQEKKLYVIGIFERISVAHSS